jgi:hypothetical protein
MKFKTIRLMSIAAAALLIATACKPRLEIRMASPGERIPNPRFVVSDPARPGQRPLYDTIRLTDAGGELYWHLRAEPFGSQNSVAQFAYADVLSGFTAVVPAKPLQTNHEYILGVVGTAFGTLRFRVDAAGKVQQVR